MGGHKMLHIAKNKDEFLNSLFQPASHGGTFDGYITKRTKNTTSLTLAAFGDFLINKHNVLCQVSYLDGKRYYSYAPFNVQDAISDSWTEFCQWCENTKKL